MVRWDEQAQASGLGSSEIPPLESQPIQGVLMRPRAPGFEAAKIRVAD